MKKLISFLLVLSMPLAFGACTPDIPEQTTEPESENVTTDEQTTEAAQSFMTIADGEDAKLYVVMPAQKCLNTYYARDKFRYFIQAQSGATLKAGTKTADFELLLGDTGRPESEELKATLTKDQYAIKIEENKIIIVATNPAFLYDAVDRLITSFITVEGKTVRLNTESAELVKNGDTTSLRYLFTQSKDLIADNYRADGWPSEIIGQADGTTHLQGGCSDGTYIYQAFIYQDKSSNEVNNVCKIVKIKPDFDPNTSNVVLTSDNIDLNHANDITYNSKAHELIVCHNNPYRTKLTVIDPDTLTVKRTETIDQNIYSITYSPERDRYMVGCSGGQSMRSCNSKFGDLSNVIKPTLTTSSMTTQGICSDDVFIYHTLWNGSGSIGTYNKNVITVYDWYGNFIGTIGTSIGIESENIFVHDGVLYVCAYSSGGKASYVYRIKPEIN
ncbi:MAG: hypothetical protein ACI3XI_06890 [Eubacteriales bacterium]